MATMLGVFCVCFYVIRYSAATNVTLNFFEKSIWQDMATTSTCTCHDVTFENVSGLRLWRDTEPIWYFEIEKVCGSRQYDIRQDSTAGRLTLQIASDDFYFTWRNLSYDDSGFYRCSLTKCPSLVASNSTNRALLKVVKFNEKPIMLEPMEANLAVFENEPTAVNFTCEGYVGLPGGSLYLERAQLIAPASWSIDKLAFFPVNASGHARGTVNLNLMYSRSVLNTIFTCWTSNRGNYLNYESSSSLFIVVQFAPVEVTFSSSNSNAELCKMEAGKYRINASAVLQVDVHCAAYGFPAPKLLLEQTAGLRDGVQLIEGSSVRFNITHVHVSQFALSMQFLCTSHYQSTTLQRHERTSSATLEVHVFAQEMTTTSSSNSYLSVRGSSVSRCYSFVSFFFITCVIFRW